jgi:hypothetical protein
VRPYDPPHWETLAAEDADRIDHLNLSPTEKKRVVEIYNRWLRILYGEAGKQLNMSGLHPERTIEMVDGDVCRIVTIQFGERGKNELFGQIWIDMHGKRPEVRYQFHGYGYPKEASIAF